VATWRTVRTGDLGRIVTGKTPSSAKPKEFGEKYPFLTPSDIPATEKYVTPERYLSDEGMQAHRRIQLPPKTTCVVCIGATVGKVCMTQSTSVSNQQINAIIPHDTKFDADFVYYLAVALKETLVGFAGGAATPIVNKAAFSSIKLRVPELGIQRKIAAILSAYDELLENNKRRVSLLQEMAGEIYRDWFVRLRFPGRQNEKFTQGRPAWDTGRVKEIVDRRPFGRIYRESELHSQGDVPVIDQSRSNVLGFHDGEAQHKASPDQPTFLFGDHTCKMVLMTEEFSLAENVIPFRPNERTVPYFLFHLIKDLARTTEYKRHWADLSNREVLIPPTGLQEQFDALVKPIHLQMQLLVRSCRELAAARDLLLPRLISGKLSLENLDIQFPPGMLEEEANEPQAGDDRRLKAYA
jgi:type I restriction enzyme, S subunit